VVSRTPTSPPVIGNHGTVYWSPHGRVLHRSPSCPKVMEIFRRVTGNHAVDGLMVFDFDDHDEEATYPPEWPLCRLWKCR
jgi:hypothetical protein